MSDDLNLSTDSEGNPDNDDPVAGLRAAVTAERTKRQEAEGRMHDLETQLAEMRGRVDGMATSQSKKDTAQPEMTAVQLRQAVEEGRISEDQAEEIRLNQAEKRIRESVTAEVKQELTGRDMAARVSTEIGRYKSLVPGINDRSSEQFAKLKGEYDYLVSMGDPGDATTELKAARAAFGPVAALEAAGKPKDRESWAESGGASDPGDRGGAKDGPPKDMPAKHREYYRKQIASGFYPDWEAVRKEWSYKPQHGRRSAA